MAIERDAERYAAMRRVMTHPDSVILLDLSIRMLGRTPTLPVDFDEWADLLVVIAKDL